MIPETRSEIFLANIAGEQNELPAPQSRIEHYLNAIAQAGDIHGGSAGAVIYDKDASYPDGSVGAAMQEMDGDISENTSDISQLKSQIEDLVQTKTAISLATTGCIWTTATIGGTVSLTPVAVSGYKCTVVECVAGDVFTINTTGGSGPRAWGFLDSDNKLLSVAGPGAVSETVTAPTNAVKLAINDSSGSGKAYKLSEPGRVDDLEDDVNDIQADLSDIGDIIYKKTIDVVSEFTDGQYISASGALISVSQLPGFKTTGLIPLDKQDAIVSIKATNIKTNASICMVAYYKTNEISLTSYISGVSPSGEEIISVIPPNAKYVVIGSNTSGSGSYTALDAPVNIYGVRQREEAPTASFVLPASYDLVVGDTFELFFKGIIKGSDSDSFYVSATGSKGAAYKKRYIVTPTEAGTIELRMSLYDVNGNNIDNAKVDLVVHDTPSDPAEEKVVLCVGDSLTENGVWVEEFRRRLTATGGTPAGFELSNIEFIGNREKNGAHYEAYGGYTFNSYNTENATGEFKKITCTHDKTSADQHSIYQDSAGNKWKLETIENGSIIIIIQSGSSSTFPPTGTLTWVSGGENHNSITYTASEDAASNPFWDDDAGKVDFGTYAESQGVSSIDYVYVLLGWNNWGRDMSYIKECAQTFITNVQTSFPNAVVVLIGLETPSLDGLANNYGVYTGIMGDYVRMMNYVHDVDGVYDDLVEENTNVYHVNLCGQFDTENNMPTGTRAVNVRNATTETYQTNGIHPAESGSLQIADAATRHIVGLLSE